MLDPYEKAPAVQRVFESKVAREVQLRSVAKQKRPEN